jgi:hypothetical protein
MLTSYRFCCVDEIGVIVMGEDRECASEMAAMEYACGLLSRGAHPKVEVWQNSIRIFIVKKEVGHDVLSRGLALLGRRGRLASKAGLTRSGR